MHVLQDLHHIWWLIPAALLAVLAAGIAGYVYI